MRSSKVPTRKPKAKGHFDRRTEAINRILAKRPPLENLNRMWSIQRSYKKMCKILHVSMKTLFIWMGAEHLLSDPNRFYSGETLSWGSNSRCNSELDKQEKKMITELYRLGRKKLDK